MLPVLADAPPVPKPKAPTSAPKTPPAAPSSPPSASSGSGNAPSSSGPSVPAAGGTLTFDQARETNDVAARYAGQVSNMTEGWFGGMPAADGLGMLTGALTTIPGLTDVEPASPATFDKLAEKWTNPSPAQQEAARLQMLADSASRAMGSTSVAGSGFPGGMPVSLPGQPSEPEFIAERAEREAALKGRGSKMKQGHAEPLTWDEYENLDPAQKSAIDFNTSLTQAVNRDRKNQDSYAPTDTQKEVYGAAVTDMFGTDGGSKLYAPETLAVLRQMNWKDQAGDLDDFLKLKVAFSAKDIKELTNTEDVPDLFGIDGAKPVSPLREVQEDLAKSQESMAHALVTGNNLLQSIGVMSRAGRQQDLGYMGGNVKPLKTTLGYGNTPDDEEFRKAFDILATKSNASDPGKMQEILGKMHAGTTPAMWDQFMGYLQSRSLNTETYGLGFAGEGMDNAQYHTPEEFRKLLGLEREKVS